MNDFFDVVRRFLLDYLPKQRCLSENTILSYRQTLNLFVAYMRDEMGLSPALTGTPFSVSWPGWKMRGDAVPLPATSA